MASITGLSSSYFTPPLLPSTPFTHYIKELPQLISNGQLDEAYKRLLSYPNLPFEQCSLVLETLLVNHHFGAASFFLSSLYSPFLQWTSVQYEHVISSGLQQDKHELVNQYLKLPYFMLRIDISGWCELLQLLKAHSMEQYFIDFVQRVTEHSAPSFLYRSQILDALISNNCHKHATTFLASPHFSFSQQECLWHLQIHCAQEYSAEFVHYLALPNFRYLTHDGSLPFHAFCDQLDSLISANLTPVAKNLFESYPDLSLMDCIHVLDILISKGHLAVANEFLVLSPFMWSEDHYSNFILMCYNDVSLKSIMNQVLLFPDFTLDADACVRILHNLKSKGYHQVVADFFLLPGFQSLPSAQTIMERVNLDQRCHVAALFR